MKMITLTAEQSLIMAGKICPYCKKKTRYCDSKEIYNGTSYGMIYLCFFCDAWVGVHKGTNNSKGRLANKELREWKKRAHAAFDPIWQKGHKSRGSAYAWLSEKLEIPRDFTHIGYFSVFTCERVVKICTEFLKPKS